ncbi:hypothetical protein N7530_011482 [Penicillium desertorum]|uniref:Uncharacterized protein n=1 Tax=Penicillium desertorum TaxID=1303715 RepID=A0A9X0BFU2_9EURO|nr:hypothetical protein N7530_011482 [Penicillium desertorum]
MAAPSSSVFSLPLPPWLHPPSTRVSQYDRRKRKKSVGWSESDLDGEETTDIASATESEPAGPPLVLTPNESHQYRIAGFPFHQELPKGHFPHEADKEEQLRRETTSRHLKDLAALSPPNLSSSVGPARQHSLPTSGCIDSDLTSIGFRMDVRNEARWGIGAEILLRRDEQKNSANPGTTKVPNPMESTPINFTTKGFAAAKEYYERLILNHPFTKSSPQSISSLHFYPAMFGLWVYITQEESKVTRKNITLRQEEEPEEFSEDENSESEFGHRRKSQNKTDAAITATRALELEKAQQIAARMDQLLGSPPYSDSPELLELRGMICLWIGDLLLSALSLPVDFEENDDPDRMLMDETPSSLEARREYRLATEKKAAEVQRSIELFEKAKKRGRSVAYNMESLHIDDDSVD